MDMMYFSVGLIIAAVVTAVFCLMFDPFDGHID